MNTHNFALRCAVLNCFLLSGVWIAQGGQQQPEASKGSAPAAGSNALTASRADTSAAPNDTTKTGLSSSATKPPAATRTAAEEDYRIGAGDVLQISVWKEPEASIPSIVVRPDGKITVPLLKDIAVVGLTPRQAEKVITQGLAGFITDPNVTVIVTGINSKKIYVIGAVKREGPLAYTYRMTILQALTEAGGLTDYAKRKKIYVLRAESGKEARIPFDYDAVLKGKDMEHFWLRPDDTLVIPH